MLGLAATALVAISLVAPQTPPPPPPDSVTAFIDVSVIPMDRERVLSGQTVLVQDGRIAAIGPVKEVKIPSDARRIDGQGKFLIPGLGDMHVHGMPIKGFLPKFLSEGVTTVRIMGGFFGDELTYPNLRAQTARGEILGPRIYTAGTVVEEISTPDEAKQVVADHKAAGYDFIKLRPSNEPEFVIPREALDTFVAAAGRAGIRWAGHSLWGYNVYDVLATKPASLEHLYEYLETATLSNPERVTIVTSDAAMNVPEAELPAAVAATKRAGVWNCPTLAAITRGATEPEVRQRLFGITKLLHDSAAGLLLGTDMVGPPSSELEAMVAAGLTPYAALETGTRNVALFLNALDSTGTVEVGKRADLVLLSANPLVNVKNVDHPVGVMLGGRWLLPKALVPESSDSLPPAPARAP